MTTSPRGRWQAWLVPSFGSLLWILALLYSLFLTGASLFAFDSDGPRHIRVGRAILERGSLLEVDTFSHTRAGAEYVPYEWLSQTILGLFDGAWGLPGAAIFAAVLFAGGVLGAYCVTRELGGPRILGLGIGVLALLLQSIHLLPRPHLFTTVLAAAYMIVLLRFARDGRPWQLAPLPILMIFWVNAHPGFLIGLVVLFAFLVAALLRSREFVHPRGAVRWLSAALGACLLATLLNPAGFGMWLHATDLLGADVIMANTQEFQSIDFHEGYGKLFFVALFAGPVTWMTGRVKVSWLGAGLYLAFAAAALLAVRNVTLFTVVALPWLAGWTAEMLRGGGRNAGRLLAWAEKWDAIDRGRRLFVWAMASVGLFVLALGPTRELYRFDRDRFPIAALEAVEGEEDFGPVFNQMRWGGYLVYERPDIPVFIDGMTNVYGEELSLEYLSAVGGRPGWDETLDRYGVEWTLLTRGMALPQLLDAHPGWARIHEDGVAVVHRRRIDGSAR